MRAPRSRTRRRAREANAGAASSSRAAEQCGRGRLPTVAEPQSFEDAIRTAAWLKIVPWEAERHARLSSYLHSLSERPRTVSVFIGPKAVTPTRRSLSPVILGPCY